jgi:uncharacterized membrane protein HdeD (DUF308 family)
MTTDRPAELEQAAAAISAAIARHRGMFLVEGLLLTVLGVLAILIPSVASIAATLVFGWILLLSGVLGLIATFNTRQAPGFGWSIVSALLGITAGIVLLVWPLQGTLSLTAVLIAFLFAEGVASIFYALEHRKALWGRWGWMLVSGLVDVGLGVMLFAGFPGTAAWALGLILGINMLFGGCALFAIALQARPTQ